MLSDNKVGVASVEPNGDDGCESDAFVVEPTVFAKMNALSSFVPDNRHNLAELPPTQRQVGFAAVLAALQS